MQIPKEVKEFVCRLEEKKKPEFQYILPKCWKQLGRFSGYHQHDANGNCILRNTSNDAVNYVNKKGQSK